MNLPRLEVSSMALFAYHHSSTNHNSASLNQWPRLELEEDRHEGFDPKWQVLIDIRCDNTGAHTVDNDLGGGNNACEALDNGIDNELAVLISLARNIFLGIIKMADDRILCGDGIGQQSVTSVAVGAQECGS
jgi:hypothetical protein